MIGSLRGKVIYKGFQKIEIESGGVGWEVHVPSIYLSKFNEGQAAEIFVYHHVAEDRDELYGFLKRKDKQVFELLLTVSGIGPKTALAIFSVGDGEKILESISKADVNFFRQVKGLGEKGSQRIIVDLKSKVGSVAELDLAGSEKNEAILQALLSLGFTNQEIRKIWPKIPSDLKEENEIIKLALKLLGKSK